MNGHESVNAEVSETEDGRLSEEKDQELGSVWVEDPDVQQCRTALVMCVDGMCCKAWVDG